MSSTKGAAHGGRKKAVPAKQLTVGSIRDFGIGGSSRYPKVEPERIPDAYSHTFLMLRHVPDEVHVPREFFQMLEEATRDKAGMKTLTAAKFARLQAWVSTMIGYVSDFSGQETEVSLERVLSLKAKTGKRLLAPSLAAVLRANEFVMTFPVHVYVNAMQYAEREHMQPAEQALWAKETREWADGEASAQVINKIHEIMLDEDIAERVRATKIPPKFKQAVEENAFSFSQAQAFKKFILSIGKEHEEEVDDDEDDGDDESPGKNCKNVTYKCNTSRDGRVFIVVQGKRVYTQKK